MVRLHHVLPSRTMCRVQSLLECGEGLATLDRALRDALDGRGRLVLVAGEAGVGKTTLVRAFSARAAAGADVLEGACAPLFTPRPLGPFADIAAAAGGGVAEAVRRSGRPHEVV